MVLERNNKSGSEKPLNVDIIDGAEGIRTPGLVNASHALCQLSYSPLYWEDRCYGIFHQPVNMSGKKTR